MQVLCGFDLVEVERVGKALDRHPALEKRVFTEAESAYCRAKSRPEQHFAARFAAKEAVGKLLGSGVLCWREIEVVNEQSSAAGLMTIAGSTPVGSVNTKLTIAGEVSARFADAKLADEGAVSSEIINGGEPKSLDVVVKATHAVKGRSNIILHGKTAELAATQGIESLSVSLTHIEKIAGASVAALAN